MNDIIPTELLNKPISELKLDLALLLMLSMLLGRAYQGLKTQGGLRGIFNAIWLGKTNPNPSSKPTGSNLQKNLPMLAIIGAAIGLLFLSSGCAGFRTRQTDITYENGKKTREITTTAKASTLFEAKSQLASFKASQTDKTQGASVGSLSQESSGSITNAGAAAGEFIGSLIRAASQAPAK